MNITIDGVTYKATYPIGATLTHEGGLNQASVQIRHISKLDPFTPFTDVHFLDEWWCIAHDEVTKERYIGKATHNITLVEITKRLERVICGAKTFTHPILTKSAHEESYPSTPTYYTVTTDKEGNDKGEDLAVTKEEMYCVPVLTNGADLVIKNDYKESFIVPQTTMKRVKQNPFGSIIVPSPNADVYIMPSEESEYTQVKAGEEITTKGALYLKFEYTYTQMAADGESETGWGKCKTVYKINIHDSEDVFSRSPLTIKEVVDRTLITAETTRVVQGRLYVHRGDRETVEGNLAIKTDAIASPEFSFADGATLKENLDQIAKFLHAKTRMYKHVVGNYYVVYFSPLTSNEMAAVNGTLIGDHSSYSAEKYAGLLHTAAQNFTISSPYEGAVAEPFGKELSQGEYEGKPMKTLRCSDNDVRINEDTGYIDTLLPIKRVISLQMCYNGVSFDITRYIREKTVYIGLSNFENEQSRAYYLYYTIGEKGIRGLFEQAEKISVVETPPYSITNIVSNATGLKLSSLETYKDLLFHVEYEPYINIHLLSSRVDGRGGKLAYIANQSASEVDKDSLADYARGTIEQMASDSPKRTYLMKSLDMVPTVGSMYDEQSYISEVSFEIYPYFVKCTVSISEHYNRLGQRVEVANAVRQYEIDVNNVRERHVLYTDACNISFVHDENASGSILSSAGKKRAIYHAADSNSILFHDISASLAQVTTFACQTDRNIFPDVANAKQIQTVNLPVLSFGFGNSLVFSVPFKDNFSAGNRAANTEASFNLNEYVQYGDVYGAAEFMKFSLYNGAIFTTKNEEELKKLGRNLPKLPSMEDGVFVGGMLGAKYADTDDGQTPYIYLFKDSREKITFTYQLLFQSDSGIIIGNDFARTSPLVTDYCRAKELQDFERGFEFDPNNTRNSLLIYFYGEGHGDPSGRVLHPITGTTAPSTKTSALHLYEEDGKLWLAPDYVYAHDSWAIIRFGKFMLGSNSPFPADGKLYFNYSHK